MAAQVVIHDFLNAAVLANITPIGPESIPATRVEMVTLTTKSVPAPADLTRLTGTLKASFGQPLDELQVYSVNQEASLDFLDPSTQVYLTVDLICIYFTPSGGSEGLGISIVEPDAGEYLLDKVADAEISWSVILSMSQNQIQSANFILANPSPASDPQIAAGIRRDVYVHPAGLKTELDRRFTVNTPITITGTNNDFDLNFYLTPGEFLLQHGGGTNWRNEPPGFSQTGTLRLSVEQVGDSNLYIAQTVTQENGTADPDADELSLPWYRRSYSTDGSNRLWSDWQEVVGGAPSPYTVGSQVGIWTARTSTDTTLHTRTSRQINQGSVNTNTEWALRRVAANQYDIFIGTSADRTAYTNGEEYYFTIDGTTYGAYTLLEVSSNVSSPVNFTSLRFAVPDNPLNLSINQNLATGNTLTLFYRTAGVPITTTNSGQLRITSATALEYYTTDNEGSTIAALTAGDYVLYSADSITPSTVLGDAAGGMLIRVSAASTSNNVVSVTFARLAGPTYDTQTDLAVEVAIYSTDKASDTASGNVVQYGGQQYLTGLTQVDVYDASTVISKPAGAKSVLVFLWGGGAYCSQNAQYGRGGAACSPILVPAFMVGNSISITIGAGGTSGSRNGGHSYFDGSDGIFATGGDATATSSRSASIYDWEAPSHVASIGHSAFGTHGGSENVVFSGAHTNFTSKYGGASGQASGQAGSVPGGAGWSAPGGSGRCVLIWMF